MTNKCLITGCRFVDQPGNRYAWGDLHQVGSAVVFNAVLHEGETLWKYGLPPADFAKEVSVPPSYHFFEQRGVIVFDKYNCRFNEQARLFLGTAPQ